MKKLVLALLAGALVLSFAMSASATELKTYGYFRAFVAHVTNAGFNENEGDELTIAQRLRPFFDFVANENLKATLGLEFDTTWGKPRSGVSRDRAGEAGMDTADNVELKRAMLTFKWPGTDVLFKVGAQGLMLPGSEFGNPVLATDVTAAVVSAPINDMFGVTFGFARPYDQFAGIGGNGGEVDAAFLVLPVKMEGVSFNPYFVYGWIDKNLTNHPGEVFVFSSNPSLPLTDDMNVWWAGMSFNVSMFDPITVNGQIVYGNLDGDVSANDRSGWFLDLALNYKMDMMTVMVYGLYATGDDDDLTDGSEFIPLLGQDAWYTTPGGLAVGAVTPFAFSERNYGLAQATPMGVWLLGFALKDISLVDNLKNTFAIEYGKGTCDKKFGQAVRAGLASPDVVNYWFTQIFTDEDSFIQAKLDSKYKIYENLSAVLELGYAKLDMDEDVWGKDYADEPAYLVTFGFTYDF